MYQTITTLVLASGSPRRRDLLSRLGLEFKVMVSGVEEDNQVRGKPAETARVWALRKAEAVAEKLRDDPGAWCLAVDTIVVVDGDILGKPGSRAQAGEYLGRISGRWHEVISAYCLLQPGSGQRLENAVSSGVKIAQLEADEIAAYLATEEPYDKAGAYAVQGIGAFMVEEIRGSYTNVVGLPLTEVVADMRRLGLIALRPGNEHGRGGR